MSYRIKDIYGTVLARNLSREQVDKYYDDMFPLTSSLFVEEESKISPEIQEHYRKLGEHYNQTAIARDIANVRKKRG